MGTLWQTVHKIITHNRTMCRVKDSEVLSSRSHVASLPQPPHSRLRDIFQKRKVKTIKPESGEQLQKKRVYSRHTRADAHMSSETVTTCTWPAEIQGKQCPTCKKGSRYKVSIQEAILQLITSGKECISFF